VVKNDSLLPGDCEVFFQIKKGIRLLFFHGMQKCRRLSGKWVLQHGFDSAKTFL